MVYMNHTHASMFHRCTAIDYPFSTGQRYTCLFVRGLHLPKGNQNPYIEEQITPCVYALWMYGFRLSLWDLQTFHTHVILLNSLQDRDTPDSVEV